MNTFQIQRFMSTCPSTRDCFLGVYACDELPAAIHVKPPFGLVANTDPSTKPGKHWVGIFVARDGHGEYFDSYGLGPLSPHFLKFLNRTCGTHWSHNVRRLQGYDSTTCGHYVIAYLSHRCSGLTKENFFSKFHISNYANNDDVILHTYKDACLGSCSDPQQSCQPLRVSNSSLRACTVFRQKCFGLTLFASVISERAPTRIKPSVQPRSPTVRLSTPPSR